MIGKEIWGKEVWGQNVGGTSGAESTRTHMSQKGISIK